MTELQFKEMWNGGFDDQPCGPLGLQIYEGIVSTLGINNNK